MSRHTNNNNESLYRLPEKDPLSQEVLEFVFQEQTVVWHLQTGKHKDNRIRYIGLRMKPYF